MCTRRRSLGLRVEKTGLLPVLSLAEGHRYHLFLSHIWATGQDQVAVIKRRLATLLPGASIFLDVDDLLSADNLEARQRTTCPQAQTLLPELLRCRVIGAHRGINRRTRLPLGGLL